MSWLDNGKKVLLLWLLWCSASLCLGEYLTLRDVAPVTTKILSVHVRYHQIDEELFPRIIQNYFQEFDPLKLYLIQSEVDSYVHSSPGFFRAAAQQFQAQDYTLFEELNRVIQKSIWRARQWNRRLPGAPVRAQSFDPVQPRAQQLQELQGRWEQFWSVKNPADQEIFREWITKNEDEYLYRNSQGVRLPEENRNHFFALHILKAVACSLDAHTTVFSESEARLVRERLEQAYVGVGIWFEDQGGRWIVTKIVEGSPAAGSGQIHAGDELISVNGQLLSHHREGPDLIKGVAGAPINLVFSRSGAHFNVNLTMQEVSIDQGRVHSDFRKLPDGGIIGYLVMDSFYESESGQGPSSQSDMINALQHLQKQGSLKAIILDLRGNAGGFIDQAVKVAGLFIHTGVVAIAKYSDGSMTYFRDTDPKCSFEGPILVMTSRLSASASEIVAQALHDYGVALVVGDHATFGKGSIQIQTLMDEHADAFYKVTVGRYYTVSGQSTQLRGATVDFIVPGPLDHQAIGESFSSMPLTPDQVPAAYKDPLSDVSNQDKLWFMQHYVPSLQQPSLKWKPAVSRLRERSGARVQEYFREKPYEQRSSEELSMFQLEEAYRIAQEMAQYH